MGFSLDVSIPAITVFLQGLLSFFSPCVLPLLPLYIGYLSGGTVTSDEEGAAGFSRGRAMLNTLFFVIGVSFAFFLLGLGMTAIGMFFGSKQLLFARIGGVIVVLFGLYQLGVFGSSGALSRERRLPLNLDKMAMSPLTALLMGFVFSFAWTPCVGPALSSVLLMAASASSKATGFLLIGVYTLGFVIPFLAVGVFTTSLLDLFKKHRGVVRYTVKIGGALMILMGVMMLTGLMNNVTGYLSRVSTPSADSAVTERAETVPPAEETAAPTPEPEEEQGQEEEAEEKVFPATDFELRDQYGNIQRLSDYRGKVVFLNFWATWCPPCRAEMPDIEKLYEKYSADPDSDVVIMGVAFPNYGSEGSEREITQFLEENGYFYPVVMDTTGDLIHEYYITAYPTTYMIDADGNIYGYATGSLTEDIMEDIIQQTIDGR